MTRMSQKKHFIEYLEALSSVGKCHLPTMEYTQRAVFLQAYSLYPIYFLKMDAQIIQRITLILKQQIDG